MSKISAEYKEIMNAKKDSIKRRGEKIADAYETKDFLMITTISKEHTIWSYSYFKLSKSWNIRLMTEQR